MGSRPIKGSFHENENLQQRGGRPAFSLSGSWPMRFSKRYDLIIAGGIIVCLLIIVGVGQGMRRQKTPLQITPDTTDEEILAADEIDWEQLRRDMIDAPPKRWTSKAAERHDQRWDFTAWMIREGDSFPVTRFEVVRRITEWFEDSADDILEEEIVADNARYHVRCEVYADGAECEIDLVGFVE
jgi:hypothetical protein